jgi:hypothetical protein
VAIVRFILFPQHLSSQRKSQFEKQFSKETLSRQSVKGARLGSKGKCDWLRPAAPAM